MRGFGVWLVVLLFVFGCSASDNKGDTGFGNGGSANGTGTGGATGTGGLNLGGDGNGTGTGGFSGNECAGVTQEANNAQVPADVIWTIDTSCSMTEETAAVRANMNKFSQLIAGAGVDIRIIMIAEEWAPSILPGIIPDDGICIDQPLGSGACPADTNFPNYLHIFETVNSTDSLQLMIQTFPTWKSALRPNSLKIFTVVTDDNSAMPSQDFINQIGALDPTLIKPGLWKMYGIFCFSDCPSAAKTGQVYADLVQLSGGIASDLCLQNFDPVFNQLAQGVIGSTTLDCGWSIPPPPTGEQFNKSKVNVIFTPGGAPQGEPIGKVDSAADCGPQGGWYYDDEANPTAVLVCDSTCQGIQSDPSGKIDVQFGCDTVSVPK